MALIEMRLLSPHQLHDILREQVLEKILGIFAWPEGRYRFLQVREFKQNVTSINLSTENLGSAGAAQTCQSYAAC